MGQRLIINIYKSIDDQIKCKHPLCNMYYHWSGYTSSALYCLNQLFDGYSVSNKTDQEIIERCIEKTSGLQQKDTDGFVDTFKYKPKIATDRNEGLVAISEELMDDFRGWAEMELDVYLKEQVFSIGDLFYNPTKDDWDWLHDSKDGEKEIKMAQKQPLSFDVTVEQPLSHINAIFNEYINHPNEIFFYDKYEKPIIATVG